MEKKKASKADLENKKNVFFMLGLVISLGIVLLAFEWKSKPGKAESLGNLQSQEVEDEFIPITREPEVIPPPPPPVSPPDPRERICPAVPWARAPEIVPLLTPQESMTLPEVSSSFQAATQSGSCV